MSRPKKIIPTVKGTFLGIVTKIMAGNGIKRPKTKPKGKKP